MLIALATDTTARKNLLHRLDSVLAQIQRLLFIMFQLFHLREPSLALPELS